MPQRYKLTIEYDGTGFDGWQKQLHAPTIQQELERAAEKLCGEKLRVFCAGRTDAGVHAEGQVAHFDAPKEYPEFNVQQGLNFHLLPHNIAVVKAEKVTEEFHARFSATARHYRYVILNRRARPALKANRVWHVPETLDLGAMQKAAALLVGTHDFSSFRASECQATSPIRTLDRLELIQVNDEIHIEASARSFLHHQMRNMAGSLRYVGNQKWSLADMQAAIDAKNRAAGGMTAPPQGLTLMRVDY